jgi:hypothetical protein
MSKKKPKLIAFAKTCMLAGASVAAVGGVAGIIPDRLLGYMVLTFGLLVNYYAARAVANKLPETWAVQLPAAPALIGSSLALTYGAYQLALTI